MLVDVEGSDLDHLLFELNQVVDGLRIDDLLPEFIYDVNFFQFEVDQETILLKREALHLFLSMERFRFPVDLFRQ